MIKKLFSIVILSISLLTNAQSVLVANINDDPSDADANGFPDNLFVSGNTLFFEADDGSGSNTGGIDYGRELWSYDSSGLNFIKNINNFTPEKNSTPKNFFEFNGQLYFTATVSVGTGIFDNYNKLFTTNGTETGTIEIVNILPDVNSPEPARAIVMGSEVYMLAHLFDETSSINQTYRLVTFDGTTATPVANADLTGGVEDVNIVGDNTFIEFNGKFLMNMNYSTEFDTVGNELYQYDPATDLFTIVKDLVPGNQSSNPNNLTIIGSAVYFSAFAELWKTDGTEAGTEKVTFSNYLGLDLAGVTSLFEWNGKLFFEGDVRDTIIPAGLTDNDQLFMYDPTDGSLTDLSQQDESHDPRSYVSYNGFLYYAGETPGSSNHSLYRTDGENTSVLIDDTIIKVDDMVLFNNELYFQAETAPTDMFGKELFKFNPSTLSVEESTLLKRFSFYPNPAKEVINLDAKTGIEKITLFNLLGQKVLDQKVNNLSTYQLNISTIEKGVYIMQLTTGGIANSYKIIKE